MLLCFAGTLSRMIRTAVEGDSSRNRESSYDDDFARALKCA